MQQQQQQKLVKQQEYYEIDDNNNKSKKLILTRVLNSVSLKALRRWVEQAKAESPATQYLSGQCAIFSSKHKSLAQRPSW